MKILRTVKKIVSKEGVLHFKRFAIIECSLFSIYIHHIYKADEDKHLHDHPWNYYSIILNGSMEEDSLTTDKNGIYRRLLKTFDTSYQKAERFHKIYSLPDNKLISLFFTGPRFREWGYNVDGKWVDNVTYRKRKNENKL